MSVLAPSFTSLRPENSPERHIIVGVSDAAIVSDRGDPIPPSDVVEELATISPRLQIVWLNGAWGTSCFVLKEQWRENDRRWERVQQGELPPHMAFDIVTRFPLGIRTADMLGWIRQRWGDRGYAKDPIKEAERAVERAQRQLAAAQAGTVDGIVEQGTRKVLDDTNHQREVRAGVASAHTMIQGADLTPDREPKRLLEVVK